MARNYCVVPHVARVSVPTESFLKLHGTAGINVAEQDGQREYGSSAGLQATNRVFDDSFFWPAAQEPSFHSRVKREPLIVFPYEKDRARENRTFFL